jgi:hypothetical protein
VEYIKSLNYLLITFSIQLYLENDAVKFGWDNELLDVIKDLRQRLSFERTANKLDSFATQL